MKEVISITILMNLGCLFVGWNTTVYSFLIFATQLASVWVLMLSGLCIYEARGNKWK